MDKELFLVDARIAARLCSVGKTLWFKLHSSGRCPMPVKLGRRTLWNIQELRAWVDAGCPCRLTWETMKKNKKSA
jgi:predicted DNA-binding transcriptional regulator AlpA